MRVAADDIAVLLVQMKWNEDNDRSTYRLVDCGALAGSFTGMVVKRAKEGFGRFTNLGIGLIGALIGGSIFRAFNIDLGLGDLAITLEDLLSALIGSLIFLGMLWIMQKRSKDKW